MISCLVLDNVCIYCIITFYCLLPSFLQIHNSDLCIFLISLFYSYFRRRAIPWMTDIKPLLLLLLLLLLETYRTVCMGLSEHNCANISETICPEMLVFRI